MDMCYNEDLVMPSSYAKMESEQMRSVHAGWCIERKWWGYNIYLTNKERKNVNTIQLIAGFGTALFTAGIGGASAGLVGGLLANYDDGYGVRVRMTKVLKADPIITGVYSLTAKQQSGIASLNKII